MRFYDPTEHAGYELDCNRMGDPRRRHTCHCFSESIADTTDQRNAVTDHGRAVSGTKNVLGTDNATVISVGDKGSLTNVTKGIDVSGAHVGGDVNVTTADPDVLKTALDNLTALSANTTKTITDLAGQNANVARDLVNGNKDKLDSLLAEVNTLATNQQSGGYSASTKWLVAIVAGVLALVAYLSRRKG